MSFSDLGSFKPQTSGIDISKVRAFKRLIYLLENMDILTLSELTTMLKAINNSNAEFANGLFKKSKSVPVDFGRKVISRL